MASIQIPLIVHIIHHLQVGGLENGLVNLINYLPDDKYRHAVICLTESSDFSKRIQRTDIVIHELHKRDGNDLFLYIKLWNLLRKLKPDIVHTRNLSALEGGVVAAFSGVPARVHGEHGRDIYDLYGKHKRYQLLRRFCAPFIQRFIALSKDLENWLIEDVRIKKNKIVQFYNGVDTKKFHPIGDKKLQRSSMPEGFADSNSIVIGTVGRLEAVKDQLTLVRAFIELHKHKSKWRDRLRLVLIGDGSLRPEIDALLESSGIQLQVWLAGNREDVVDILPELDIFVLPSLGEGISNTILEAMACQLPVVATHVGGNSELVQDAITGRLVPPNDPDEMSNAIYDYVIRPDVRQSHAEAGRKRAEQVFSIDSMLMRYMRLYDELLNGN